MQLKPEQLPEHCKQPPHWLYLISGDEALLQQEVCDQLRACCRTQGVSERELFTVDTGFKWQSLIDANNNLSLFGDRKLIEVRMNSAKFDDQAKKVLQEYAANPNPDNVVMLIVPKLDKKQLSTKWMKTLEQAGVLIQTWPVKLQQMPQWIRQRMVAKGLQPTPDAVEHLAERVEGNLLAAQQEIEKLLLLQGTGAITAEDIQHSVDFHARYSVFDWVDEAIKGNYQHALTMLQQLQQSGMEPSILIWAIGKELRDLSTMAQQVREGRSVMEVMKQQRVWSSRQGAVKHALESIRPAVLKRCLIETGHIDQAMKGLLKADPWLGFSNIILWLSGQIKPGQFSIDA